MKISFDIGIDDVIAFHSDYYDIKFTDNVAKQLRWTYWVLAILAVVAGVILFLIKRDWGWLAALGIVALACAFAGFISFRQDMKRVKSNWLKKARRAVDVAENAVWFGRHTIEFDDEKVTSDSDREHQSLLWSAFVRTSETDEHFLFYISDAQAIIVPKRAMTGTQIDELTQLLNNKIKK